MVRPWAVGVFTRLFQYIPSFPPLWREPLCPPQVREGRTAGGSLASLVSAEPGVLATRARMTGGGWGVDWRSRRSGFSLTHPPKHRHSRPCGGKPSIRRKGGRGEPPAVRWRRSCQLNQGFSPQGRE
ncbi:hypothetical protein EIB18_18605 [Caulobacter vibrioides]|uniref:Uncharacterized protein n=1 Tax=Caulobacter vibrioides (strain NA1000 / CB15N) TaxID=565050 RepID=A0A0H3CDV6_CAUVN|nr:hypothetical protein [Caulobacter vibrioides]YP_002519005.1 hypothetical protein CCNA_03632 [Caulobacter vibrioides NA1000]ACL97097.1 hypothetical protein CCNA_03632 [Caulobacter vibrioides NA1000]ATC30331.1 hypothetical protein CA607_18860 [Caulobacter vibrioides]AZH14508.1 hypothetical protein EIB18_18605 [Caulobacter vibrioides]QXZ51858.1 hypothetical protein KZH45_18600 [Caulobacter vibrioides]